MAPLGSVIRTVSRGLLGLTCSFAFILLSFTSGGPAEVTGDSLGEYTVIKVIVKRSRACGFDAARLHSLLPVQWCLRDGEVV